jgi:hypothetical protein
MSMLRVCGARKSPLLVSTASFGSRQWRHCTQRKRPPVAAAASKTTTEASPSMASAIAEPSTGSCVACPRSQYHASASREAAELPVLESGRSR